MTSVGHNNICNECRLRSMLVLLVQFFVAAAFYSGSGYLPNVVQDVMPENWECLNLLPSLDIERFIEVLIVDGS